METCVFARLLVCSPAELLESHASLSRVSPSMFHMASSFSVIPITSAIMMLQGTSTMLSQQGGAVRGVPLPHPHLRTRSAAQVGAVLLL